MLTQQEKINIINTINNNTFSNYDYNCFYKIINNDTTLYTKNKNGVFISSNNISDNAYTQMNSLIQQIVNNKKQKNKLNNSNPKMKTDTYSKLSYETSYDNLYYKLSNYEKNVIKKNKSYLNDTSESISEENNSDIDINNNITYIT
jgi:hypothetical protein